jgi:radical SAM protein with 4Fe4S-binding SPASM domain
MTELIQISSRLERQGSDSYGWARMPGEVDRVEAVDRIPYGRFRNVYLYITEKCQLRCGHCYMGERLERAIVMPYEQVCSTLLLWRKMGGSKLTILGGEPSLHPDFVDIIRFANQVGYEHVILTTNGLRPAAVKLAELEPADFAYVQVSLDGGSARTHESIRGHGTFGVSLETMGELCRAGFDTRIICTVNRANREDVLDLLPVADDLGVSLVKYHVFSVIGRGHGNDELAMEPPEWIDFYEHLDEIAGDYKTRIWYQPTYARREHMARFEQEGYRGCIGRTLDRISIFPDGRCYVCSYLFDTDFQFAEMVDGQIELNKGPNEFDLFTSALSRASCGSCKAPGSCMGGCPAEEVVMGESSCHAYEDIVPVCRLWKSVRAGDNGPITDEPLD